MKLIFCHIENFGRLRNFDYRFEEGLNVICRENGWGKSTFSAFLRAMFYGFSGSRRKKAEENERERYRPWQGGVYGGLLVFEAGGKTYEMTRIFGRRESEDEFELRDAGTNLLCGDFSARIGEELFCIDRESFSRTVFTGQQDCPAAATDDVNALVADLTGRVGDMGDYEAAMKRLMEAANRLTPKRRTGSLYRRGEEIRRLEREKSSGAELAEKIKICGQREREAAAQEERLTAKLQGLESQIRLAAEREEEARRALERETLTAGNREVYRRLCAARDHRKKEFEKASSFFPGRVPSLAEVEQNLSGCREMERIEARIQASALDKDEQRRLSDLEEEFRGKGNSPYEVFGGKGNSPYEVFGGKEEAPYEAIRGKEEASEEETRQKRKLPGKENRGIEKTSKEDNRLPGTSPIERSRRPGTSPGQGFLYLVCCLAGAVLFAAGLTGAILIHEALFAVVSAVGALTTAAGLYFYFINVNNVNAVNNINTVNNINNGNIVNDTNMESDPEKKPDRQWNGEADDENGLAGLTAAQNLREARREYLNLLEKERRTDELYGEWSGIRKPILDFLKELGFSPREDLRAQLETLRDAADDCEDAGKLLREAEGELRLYQSEMSAKGIGLPVEENKGENSADNSMPEAEKGYGQNRAGQGRNEERTSDSEDRMRNYRREADETHAALMRCREKRADCSREMEELHEEYEEWEYSMQCLETMRAQQAAESVRYGRVIAAAACLSKAKETMTARYADPIAGHFRRYWEMITGYSAAGIQVDAESRVTIEERGKKRQASLLSAGYRDLAGICLRVALADAMYPPGRRERPPLIMDDPFTGLDDEKMDGAMRFLRETGKTYQILYFTCSASRC